MWNDFTAEAIVAANTIQSQGFVQTDTAPKMANGGDMMYLPSVEPINTGVDTQITSSSTLSATALTDQVEKGVVVRREKAWVISDFWKTTQGTDLLKLVAPQVSQFIAEQQQTFLAAVTAGVFGGPLLDTHVYDGTGGTITQSAIGSAALLMGEKMSGLTGLVMHSKVFNDALQDGLATYQNISGVIDGIFQQGMIPFMMGKKVWLNDAMCAATNSVYPTYLVGGQPWYIGFQKNITFEEYREPMSAGGQDNLIVRYHYCPHIKGVSYTNATMNPTAAQLATTTYWTQTALDKNIKLVQLNTL